MGEDQFASTLLGTRRKEMAIADALRGLLQGILDGYERLAAIADAVKEDREALRLAAMRPLNVLLVHADEKSGHAIEDELNAIRHDNSIKHLNLTFAHGKAVKADDSANGDAASKAPPDPPVTFMRITRGASGEHPVAPPTAKPGPFDPFPSQTLQFSALSELAVAPQREQEVNARLLREAATRLTQLATSEEKDHSRLGCYFATAIIPDDFRKLIEGPASLMIEVDEASAVYPWEMIAATRFAKTSFVSHNIALSRQFRSLLSPSPTSPPALNTRLKVLVIADPAPGLFALPGARREGLAVVDVLEKARIAWGDRYDITAEVRIGPGRDAQAEQMLKALRRKGTWLNAQPCDPLELAMLIVNDQQDIIHYAGHGVADEATGQTGWVFAPDCVLSAKDIFRVRQVPRLVFANACFSALTSNYDEMRKHVTGLAQAFFARGIPNFIGAGWAVDDACAEECARWFYARLLGLSAPDAYTCDTATMAIGQALKAARERTFALNPRSASWGAYQHYGNPHDRLVAYQDLPPQAMTAGAPIPSTNAPTPSSALGSTSFAVAVSDAQAAPFNAGHLTMSGTPLTAASPSSAPQPGNELIYVNGIDFDTGQYAVPPQPIEEIAKRVFQRPRLDKFSDVHEVHARSFGIPFGVDLDQPGQVGWGIVFHPDTPQDVRAALAPLIAHRRGRIGDAGLVKELDYQKGEQTRDWYRRHGVSPGAIDPTLVPYYLLLVGGPELIPFEFQYLLGVDYAVGRLAFDNASEYEHYVHSLIAYETADAVPNGREIAYWGTRHPNDPATNLSASQLIDPLANGLADGGLLKTPIHADPKVNYQRKLMAADSASKANLLDLLHQPKPPALLFTASHGMQLRSGQSAQASTQGALLCQDWPAFSSVKPAHILAAADVSDDANVNGMVAMIFACFGAGTPDVDQFLMDLSQADSAPTLAPKPFMSALPRRLLTHPNGSALAVIGHVDRAWAYSIQAPQTAGPQILAFRNSLGFMMSGAPVGFALSGQFSSRFAALSAALLSATSPTAPPAMRLPDRDLVTAWIQRNDAQNYVLLGDPAVQIRTSALA
jgi:CHAT domain/Peptidase family C25